MNGFIAVTDKDWFEFLSQQKDLDEVNFWRPSDTRSPQQLRAGMPLLFKLRKRFGGWIVGWGIFERHDVSPAWLAWDAFGSKNGAATLADMRRRIEQLRADGGATKTGGGDYEIGCLMLSGPVFLPRDAWVKPPAGWPENVVQGKGYDLSTGEGARVWQDCLAHGAGHSLATDQPARVFPAAKYSEPMLARRRLGQGIFRLSVTDAYGRACAVTSEHSLPALEAAHSRPFGDGGEHAVSNGLLLRSDIHRLFDKGYVGVSSDHHFVVSKKLKDDFSNGRSYYPLHGSKIRLPERDNDRPAAEFLKWHMESTFRD
jgi:putative restriction endonuclease